MPDEAGIDRCIEPAILGRDVIHSFAVSDIERFSGALATKSCVPVSARIFLRTGASSLCAVGLVEPDDVDHCQINVDHHDMPPIRGGPISARRSIDAEGGPQEIGLASRPELDEQYRTELNEAAKQLCASLAPRSKI